MVARRKPPSLVLDYNRKGDVLYSSFGKPRPAFTRETPDGVLLRFDFDTEEVAGFTIPNFQAWLAKKATPRPRRQVA